MREYLTQAVILSQEPYGEADLRITVWSRTFGKLRGRTTSTRKIISKLAAHLESGLLSDLRLVEQKNLRVVDALKIRRLPLLPPDLVRLDRLLEHSEPDEDLWTALTAARWSWSNVLGVMGWDPRHATCANCGRRPEAFSIPGQEFFCDLCASKLPADALIYLHNAAL